MARSMYEDVNSLPTSPLVDHICYGDIEAGLCVWGGGGGGGGGLTHRAMPAETSASGTPILDWSTYFLYLCSCLYPL